MQAIQLPSRCDRTAALAAQTELLEAQADTAIKLDAGKVEQIGQSMIQLLAAAAQSDAGLELVATSNAFEDAVRLAKLEDLLRLEEVQ